MPQEEKDSQTKPMKRKKVDRRLEAAKIISPRFMAIQSSLNNDTSWKPSEKDVVSSTTTEDAKDIRAILYAITRGDAKRAANAVTRMLGQESNLQIKTAVLEAISAKDNTTGSLILGGIKECISHHTNSSGGTRETASETLVKNIAAACMFKVVKDKNQDIREADISHAIGITCHQLKLARSTVQDLISNKSFIKKLQRKKPTTNSQSSVSKNNLVDDADGVKEKGGE